MMTDPIADMLTRIRNAAQIGKKEVVMPFSKIKLAIARILVREGYLEKAEEGTGKPASLVLRLRYNDGVSAIHELTRVSVPSHRRYVKSGDIDRVLHGFGVAIMSTPKGVMTGSEARALKVGGEVICEVY